LAKAVGRARAALQGRGGYLERIAVTLGKRTVFVETSASDWIEARDNYACLHVGQQQHLVRETLTTLEATLDPKHFVRIHRSAIVRFERSKGPNLGLGDHAVVVATAPSYRSARNAGIACQG
jgi:two-component system LytT family response regulator